MSQPVSLSHKVWRCADLIQVKYHLICASCANGVPVVPLNLPIVSHRSVSQLSHSVSRCNDWVDLALAGGCRSAFMRVSVGLVRCFYGLRVRQSGE